MLNIIASKGRFVMAQVLAALALVLVSASLAQAGKHESVILHFNQKKGAYPVGGLVPDGQGNLYGTTLGGGLYGQYCGLSACGVIFELSPASGGKWTETVLYKFKGGTDGFWPMGTLIFDAKVISMAPRMRAVPMAGARYSS